MKKVSFIVLLIVCVQALQAQLEVGLKGGVNLSSFNATNFVTDVSYSQKTNFNAGLVVSIPLGKSGFSVQPEAVYSGEGANITTLGVTGVYNFQMLNFPVLLKYLSPYHFFIETGLQMGFMLSGTLDETGFPSNDIKSQTKTTQYAWVAGVGYQLPMNLGLDVRYNLGLTSLADANSGSYNGSNLQSNVFQVGIYYLFGNLFPASKE